jgi:hypothetical protein
VADVDQITDDLRAQLHVIASDIGAFAIGTWRAPDQVYHSLEILEGRLQRIRSERRQHSLVKVGPYDQSAPPWATP